MEDHHHHHHHQEMQLLPCPNLPSSSHFDRLPPSVDLQLSISLTPSSDSCALIGKKGDAAAKMDLSCIKWQAAEQIRLAAMEQAYAEHVMELTRREMELAQSEFEHARALWETAMEEVERAENIKERAASWKMMTGGDEITCLSCRHKFRP